MSGLTTSEICPRCGRECYIKDDKIFCFKCQLYLPTCVCDCCGEAFLTESKLRWLEGREYEELDMEKVCRVCFTEVVCHDAG